MLKYTHQLRPSTVVGFLIAISLLICGCSSGAPQPAKVPLSGKPKTLIVGDSLTVGGFGEELEQIFTRKFGADKVAVFGCCGASVEHFLKDHPVFICTCGYRETTREKRILDNWEGGQKPGPFPVPKLANLIKKHQPEIVILQLGTNNFDTLIKEGPEALADQTQYFERLAKEMVTTTRTVRRAIWVTPPDSSKYPPKIEQAVNHMIEKAARKHEVHVIDSSQLTKYTMGKTGTDGVHYHTKPAKEWVEKVHRKLLEILPPGKGWGPPPHQESPVTPQPSR